MPEAIAFRERAGPEFDGAVSSVSLTFESGPAISVWSSSDTMRGQTDAEATLELAENQHVVIGRQEGGRIEYLDPDFQPTRMVPQTGQCVLTQYGHGSDRFVSRGHFLLRARRGGMVLVNGVPRRGGGIRPPLNGTVMLSPVYRWMSAGEEFCIEPGTLARIQLPNGTVVAIQAN